MNLNAFTWRTFSHLENTLVTINATINSIDMPTNSIEPNWFDGRHFYSYNSSIFYVSMYSFVECQYLNMFFLLHSNKLGIVSSQPHDEINSMSSSEWPAILHHFRCWEPHGSEWKLSSIGMFIFNQLTKITTSIVSHNNRHMAIIIFPKKWRIFWIQLFHSLNCQE